MNLNPVVCPFDYTTISDVVLHIQYTSQRADSLVSVASGSVTQYLKGASDTSLERGLGLLFDPRADCPAQWAAFRDSGTMYLDGKIFQDGLPFYAKSGLSRARRVRITAEYETDISPILTLSTKEKHGPSFDLSLQSTSTGKYIVGSDERSIESLDISWKMGSAPVGWVLSLDGADAVNMAKKIKSVLLVIGYSLEV